MKKRGYKYTRLQRIDFVKDYLTIEGCSNAQERESLTEWIVDYTASTPREKMRPDQIPQDIFDMLNTEELDGNPWWPNDLTGAVVLMLYILSDPVVRCKAGICNAVEEDLLNAYRAFGIEFAVERLRRRKGVDYRVTGGDIFTGFDYEFSLLPFYEMTAGMLEVSIDEAFQLVRQGDVETIEELIERAKSKPATVN